MLCQYKRLLLGPFQVKVCINNRNLSGVQREWFVLLACSLEHLVVPGMDLVPHMGTTFHLVHLSGQIFPTLWVLALDRVAGLLIIHIRVKGNGRPTVLGPAHGWATVLAQLQSRVSGLEWGSIKADLVSIL